MHPNRIGGPETGSNKFFIDDGHVWRSRAIGVFDRAPPQHWNLRRAEEIWTDYDGSVVGSAPGDDVVARIQARVPGRVWI